MTSVLALELEKVSTEGWGALVMLVMLLTLGAKALSQTHSELSFFPPKGYLCSNGAQMTQPHSWPPVGATVSQPSPMAWLTPNCHQ